MRGSSTSDARRRGFAIAWAMGFMVVLMVLAFGIFRASNEGLHAVARSSAGHIYVDLCLSALAEAIGTVKDAASGAQPLGGLNIETALGPGFPFDQDSSRRPLPGKPIEVPLTAKLARELYGSSVTVAPVRIASGSRMAPGEGDPLIGTIQLIARATGTVRGISTGREVRHVYGFSIPCRVSTMGSGTSEYASVAFGKPTLFTQRMGALSTTP